MTTDNTLDGWEHSEFTAAGITHGVFRRGSGPLVIVIHEIPGITPKVKRFAEEVEIGRASCRERVSDWV